MFKIKIQKISEEVKIPNYAYQGDAGIDLYSAENDYVLRPNEHRKFATGIKIEIPEGHAGLIWDKSGLALKHCIKIMGGVIDSTYRGEIAVILINLGKKDYRVEKNAKIAQMLFQKVEKAEIEEVENLSDTQRGEGGFGSSGTR
ncbi:dUTP diphosphatase [Candidatus Parcubacteria bacterium]|nr:dUTP diphosphatase [Candidatus Parcubacteria bacterium]